MFELIKSLWNICLFKKGPESLPHSMWLLRLLVLADVIVSFLLAAISSSGIKSLLQAVLSVVFILVFAWGMLAMARKSARFLQTACALLGTDTLISFFAIPGSATVLVGFYSVWVSWLMTGLVVWHWIITGHIIRKALGQPWTFGLGLAFLYILACYRVMGFLMFTLGNI